MSEEEPLASALGPDAASVMRIVAHFDRLAEQRVDAAGVVRSAALFAGCGVGARRRSGEVVRYDARGEKADGAAPGGQRDRTVWLERTGVPHALDPVLLDRLAHTLRGLDERPAHRGDLRLGDPALVEVLLSGEERRADRARAAGLLDLAPNTEVRVLAVYAERVDPVVAEIARSCPGALVRSGPIGNLTAVLTQAPRDTRTLCGELQSALSAARRPDSGGRGPWLGIGERVGVYEAPNSWAQARRALRFASSTVHGRQAVSYAGLGPLDLLADVPLERLLGTRGIAHVNALASTAAGAQAVGTLEAFCVYGSLRRTAAELHVHHSTVASRLAHVEAELGWDLANSVDRFMATLVLMLRRMALSTAELAASESGGG